MEEEGGGGRQAGEEWRFNSDLSSPLLSLPLSLLASLLSPLPAPQRSKLYVNISQRKPDRDDMVLFFNGGWREVATGLTIGRCDAGRVEGLGGY